MVKKYIHAAYFSLFIILNSVITIAQNSIRKNNISGQDMDRDEEGFQMGYIIMRVSGDTIYGLVKKKGWYEYDAESVDFKINSTDKRKPFRADSIIEFRSGDVVYRYFYDCRWAKLILSGSINVYKGMPATVLDMGTYGPRYCFAFKKGNQKEKFIRDNEIKLLTGMNPNGGILTKKAKNFFKEYIADNSEILAEFEKENFRFYDLITIIAKYNESAKIKKQSPN